MVTVIAPSEHNKTHETVYFKKVNFMVFELYINYAVIYKTNEPKNNTANSIFVQLFSKLDQLFLYDKSLKTKPLGLNISIFKILIYLNRPPKMYQLIFPPTIFESA